MTEAQRRSIADLALSILVAAGAAILFIGAAELPPPRFEPLGSAALPKILGALLIFFALILATRATIRFMRGWTAPTTNESTADPRKGAAVLIALIAYVFVLDVLRIPFVPATVVFVTVVGLIIGATTLRTAAIFAGIGLVLSLAISSILSRFLFITIG